jgi:hypothetical protein
VNVSFSSATESTLGCPETAALISETMLNSILDIPPPFNAGRSISCVILSDMLIANLRDEPSAVRL